MTGMLLRATLGLSALGATAGLIALLSGCEPSYLDEDFAVDLLLDEALGRAGNVYMLAPETDSLVVVDPGTRSYSRIGVGRDPRVLTRPAGSGLLFTLELGRGTLSRIDGGGAVTTLETGVPFNALQWSPDGTRGLAYIDPSSPVQPEVEGSLNPNAVALLTELSGALTATQFTLTDPPEQVQFDPTGRKVLVSTRTRLHVIDAETLDEVGIPFSTSDAQPRAPQLVVVDPAGERAMVTVAGLSDLFIVSLGARILIENVVGLPRSAVAAAFSADGRRGVLADGSNQVTFLDLESFEAEQLVLEGTVDTILPSHRATDPFALLFDSRVGRRLLTRVDLSGSAVVPDDPESWRLPEDTRQVMLEPGDTAAVVLHDDGLVGGSGARALSLFHFEARGPSRIFLDSVAGDLLFLPAGAVTTAPEAPHVVVTLPESGRLVRYDLHSYAQVVLDTYDFPTRLGLTGAAGAPELFVVHDELFGLVSFVPASATEEPPGGFPAVAGMALGGLLDRR